MAKPLSPSPVNLGNYPKTLVQGFGQVNSLKNVFAARIPAKAKA
jgi:hypothetical protein